MNPNKSSKFQNTSILFNGPGVPGSRVGANTVCPAHARWQVKRYAALCTRKSRTPKGPFDCLKTPSYSLAEEQQRLFQRMSGYLVPAFERFVKDLADDEVIAVLLTSPLTRADGALVMPIDDIQRHAANAMNMLGVLSHERYLVMLAALIQPLGHFLQIHHMQWKAWGGVHPNQTMQEVMLQMEASGDPGSGTLHSQFSGSGLADLSLMLVESPMRRLRRESTRAANILCSVCTGREYEDMDAQQIHRMSAAVHLSQTALKSKWRGR